MSSADCCVCGKPAESTLGERAFCSQHLSGAKGAGGFSWSHSGVIEAVITIAAVAVAQAVGGMTVLSMSSGVLLALVPALLWLTYVYRQDRLEPEPIGLVVGVAIMGGLVAAAVSLPLSAAILGGWGDVSALVGGLVRGPLVLLGAFLAVRYTVFLTDEFDEPIDALVYVTAAMVGTATVLNLLLVRDGVVLGNAGAQMASNVLIAVASGMPLAYGLGLYRFGPRPQGHVLAVGFAVAIGLYGGLSEAVLLVSSRGLSFHGLEAASVAAAVCGLVLVVGHFLTARLRALALEQGTAYTHHGIHMHPSLPSAELGMFGVVVVLLLGGSLLARTGVDEPASVEALDGRVSVVLPAGWSGTESDGVFLAGPAELQVIPTVLKIQAFPSDSSVDVDLRLLALEEQRRDEGFGYRVLRSEEQDAFGATGARWSWFAMAVESSAQVPPQDLPVVVRGVDVLLPDMQLSVGLSGPAAALDEEGIVSILSNVEVMR